MSLLWCGVSACLYYWVLRYPQASLNCFPCGRLRYTCTISTATLILLYGTHSVPWRCAVLSELKVWVLRNAGGGGGANDVPTSHIQRGWARLQACLFRRDLPSAHVVSAAWRAVRLLSVGTAVIVVGVLFQKSCRVCAHYSTGPDDESRIFRVRLKTLLHSLI